VFAEAGEEHSDAVEVWSFLGVLDPTLLHQRDELLVNGSVGADIWTVGRHRMPDHQLQDLYE